jgi:hypothetical protein
LLLSEDKRIISHIQHKGNHYCVKNLPADSYMRCDAAVGTSAPIKRFKLAEGEAISIDIAGPEWQRLPAGILDVHVFTMQGLPLPGARMWLEGRGTTIKPNRIYDETHIFSGKAGEYTLHVVYPGFKEARQSVTLSDAPTGARDGSRPTAQVRLERESSGA